MKLEYSGAERNGKLNILIEIILALILGCASFFVFVTMFRLKYSPDTMFTGSIGSGIAGIWNSIADTLGASDYVILPKYKADVTSDGIVRYGMALTFVLVIFTLLSYLIIKARTRVLLLIPVIPLVIFMAAFKIGPSLYAGIFFAGALIVVLGIMNIKGKVKPTYFIVPLIAVLIGAGITVLLDQTVSLIEPKPLAEYGKSVRASIDRSRYGTDALPAGDIAGVDGKELKEARGSIGNIKTYLMSAGGKTGLEKGPGSETALKVTMNRPESYYLRGFVGSDYDGSRWSTLSDDTFYDMRDQLFWLNRRGFDGLSEMAHASRLGQAVDDQDVSIKIDVKDASKRIAFTPYELVLKPYGGNKARKSELKLPKGTKNYGGSFLGTEGFSGKPTYSYKASANITGIWTDAVGKFYTTKADEDINRFFISESHYNVVQYDKYLDVPEKLLPAIKKEIGETGDISKNHADYKDTIDIIQKYLKEKYIYSETFKSPESGKDFIESFISAKRGCDIHYATLAVMLFRYFGIPARYVEGYLVTPQNVMGMTGKAEVNVPKGANHAWTEIYIDGFGWIPFEATPEYAGVMKEADLTKGLQNVDYESIQQNRIDAEEEKPVEEENEENNKFKRILIAILLVILAYFAIQAVMLIIVLLLMKLFTMIKWRKAFADKDPKNGIKALYQYSVNKKWKLADKGESLGMRASYSNGTMAEGERTAMREEVKQAKERSKQDRKKKVKKSAEKSTKQNSKESTEKKG